jgi:polyhydroxybutyrate depolymerase
MLDDLSRTYSIDQKAVFITGFSSGATMLFRVANELPGRFAAIAPVSGHYWPPATSPPNPQSMPTILIVGTEDPLNPFDGGTISLPWGSFEQPPFMNTILGWAKRNGFPEEFKLTTDKPGVKILHAAKDNYDCYQVYVIEGLGHMWPGGEAIFPESFIGKDPGTLQATEVIWQYFAQVRSRNR